MRLLTIGDLHYKTSNFNESSIFETKLFEWLDGQARAPDVIVLLGDIMDRFGDMHMSVRDRVLRLVDKLSTYSKLFVIIGNHDRPHKEDFCSDIHPFQGYCPHNDRVVIVSKRIQWEGFIFVPYVTPGRLLEVVGDTTQGNIRSVFAHQEVKGVFPNCEDEWPPSFPLLISGHIHQHMEFDNVFYTGTPYQIRQGETAVNGLWLWNFSDDITKEFITLDLPKKITLNMNVEQMTWDEVHRLDTGGDDVRIILKGSTSEIRGLKKLIVTLKKKGFKVQTRAVMGDLDRLREYGNNIHVGKKKFSEVLEDKVKQDGCVEEIYVELFKRH